MRCSLSVIDIQSPLWLAELVPALDELGYHRYWTTEHHGPGQSANPFVTAALAAGLCERMRVGTAGPLVALRSPRSIAEDHALLQALFPGRVALGLAGACPAGEDGVELLDGRERPDHERLRERVERTVALATADHPAAELWLLGTSVESARLAGRLGVSFGFHDYLFRQGRDPRLGPPITAAYREAFVPCARQARPRVLVAAYGLCASGSDEAEAGGRAHYRHRPTVPSFCGDAERVAATLTTLAASYGADELAIQSFAPDLRQRLRSYALVAEAWARAAAHQPTTPTVGAQW